MRVHSLRALHDINAALKALDGHPVYRWLKQNIGRTVATDGDGTVFVQFRRARVVVRTLPGDCGTLHAAGPQGTVAVSDNY
jgi:hypothetical protein